MLKKIVPAVVILVVLVAALIISNKIKEDEKSKQEQEKKIIQIDLQGVKKIILERPGGKFVFKKVDTVWYLSEPLKDVADKYSVINIISTFNKKKYDRIISDNPKDFDVYGLKNPLYKLTFVNDKNNKVTLLLGRKSPTTNRVYVRYENGKRIYLIPGGFMYNLKKEASSFRDKKIFKYFYSNSVTHRIAFIKIVTYKNGKKYYEIDKVFKKMKKDQIKKRGLENIYWDLKYPVEDDTDGSTVRRVTDKVRKGVLAKFISRHPSKRVLKRYGLINSPYVVDVYYSDGKKMRLNIGNELSVPKGQYYAFVEGYPDIFTVRQSDVNVFFQPVEDLRTKNLGEFFADEVTGIIAGKWGRNISVLRSKDWRWVDNKNQEHDPNDIYQYLNIINDKFGTKIQYDDKSISSTEIGKVILYDAKGSTVLNLSMYKPKDAKKNSSVLWVKDKIRNLYILTHLSTDDLVPDYIFKTKAEREKEKNKEQSNKNK